MTELTLLDIAKLVAKEVESATKELKKEIVILKREIELLEIKSQSINNERTSYSVAEASELTSLSKGTLKRGS